MKLTPVGIALTWTGIEPETVTLVKAEPPDIDTETAATTVPAARIIRPGRSIRGETDAGRYGIDLDLTAADLWLWDRARR